MREATIKLHFDHTGHGQWLVLVDGVKVGGASNPFLAYQLMGEYVPRPHRETEREG